ncbi:hypothetical protein [Neorhizobium sp. NCHU2750]|uniref:hypothetical protein n=1 Tax=Neorhizobium sp. NCHU2750 TaxID=1825976 RepID=UPI000E7659F2|nr:hypothetical protein NCHU2750_12460 [Neorhizobium sp. NCHU2750]
MTIKYAAIAAALALTGLANGALADERVINGTFSSGLSSWSTSGTGVTVENDAAYKAPAVGGSGSSGIDNYVAFGAGQITGGSLFQTFATVAGEAYTLTYNFAGFGSTSTQSLLVTASNASSDAEISSTKSTVKASKLSTSLNDIFEDGYLYFVATSSLTTLTFKDISTSSINADMLLANVSVTGAAPTPVPGPEAGAGLGALAMGGVALYLKRRRQPLAS